MWHMPQAGGPGPDLPGVQHTLLLLSSFVSAVHWKGTDSGLAVEFLFVFSRIQLCD